jgi:hypothetical protein
MKIRTPILLIASMAAFAPLAASAATAESIRACMDSFAAQSFPDKAVSFVVAEDRSFTIPLVALSGTQTVQLVASEKSSGRVIATATCKVRSGGKQGNVSVGPLTTY